jgi:hypothetical protein
MVHAAYAECCLYLSLFMLNVAYTECVTAECVNAECVTSERSLCRVLFMLSAVYAECSLCCMSLC